MESTNTSQNIPTNTATNAGIPSVNVNPPTNTNPPVKPPTNAGAPQENPEKPMANPKTALIILGSFGIVIIILIIAIIIMFATKTGVTNNNVTKKSVQPSPELAESVCQKYGGEFQIIDGSNLRGLLSSDGYSCTKSDDNDEDIAADEFQYIVAFMDGVDAETWKEISFIYASSGTYTVLENSDEYLKTYMNYCLPVDTYEVFYKNAASTIMAGTRTLAEDLLVELGFPDRNRADSDEPSEMPAYCSGNSTDENNSESNAENSNSSSSTSSAETKSENNEDDEDDILAVTDTDYYDALLELRNELVNFLEFNGSYPKIEDGNFTNFDNVYETANYDFYILKPYNSFADSPFHNKESDLAKARDDYIYIFYNSTCEKKKVVASENTSSFALVHSTKDNKNYICVNR